MQAPVGNDDFSFGYRDLEGSKVHKGLREEYGAPYGEVSHLCDMPSFWLYTAAMSTASAVSLPALCCWQPLLDL